MSKTVLGIMTFVFSFTLVATCYAGGSCEAEFKAWDDAENAAVNAQRDADAAQRKFDNYDKTEMNDAQDEFDDANKEIEKAREGWQEAEKAVNECHDKYVRSRWPQKCGALEREQANAQTDYDNAKMTKASAEKKLDAVKKKDHELFVAAEKAKEKADDKATEKNIKKKKDAYNNCIDKRKDSGSKRPDPAEQKPKSRKMRV